MKLLSIIVPTYNSEKYLKKCLQSFLLKEEKLMDLLEIIVINDGSTDKSGQIAEWYQKKYPNSFLVIEKENGGHGSAINVGAKIATGKYMKIVDADDWVETEGLSKILGLLEEKESDVLVTHYHTIDISSRERKNWKVYCEQFNRDYTLEEIMEEWDKWERGMTFHGIFYLTKFYQNCQYQLSEHIFYEDHEYTTLPCSKAETICALDLFFYEYRVGDIKQSVSDESQLKRLSHSKRVIYRLLRHKREKQYLSEGGRRYWEKKTALFLLSYYVTVLIREPNKRKGRKEAKQITDKVKRNSREIYRLIQKKYFIFLLLNYLGISINMYHKLLESNGYRIARKKHDFHS